MTPNFWLPTAAVLIFSTGLVRAQQSSFSAPDDPIKVAAGHAMLRQAEQLKDQAKTALAKGDLTKAAALLEQALRTYNFLEEARIRLADLYIQQNKPDDVIRTLRPMVYPLDSTHSLNRDPTVRMKMVLALLDKREWEEAVRVYEASVTRPVEWQISNVTSVHALPNPHFSPDYPDDAGMRAQAHLILGARQPMFVDWSVTSERIRGTESMLDHLRQVQAIDPRSLDAAVLTGTLLNQLDRFAEARKAYQWASRLAPAEGQPEIKAAVDEMNAREHRHKQAAQQPNQTGKP